MTAVKDNLICIKKSLGILLWTFINISFFVYTASAQDIPTDGESLLKGKQLYLHHCRLCHGISNEVIGPSLVNITEKRPSEWLLHFIKNSQQMIVENDSVASFLYEQYNHNVMPSFHWLSEDDIYDILGYIHKQSFLIEDEEIKYEKAEGEAPVVLEGKQLFNNQCGQCHAVGHQIIGPGLASVPKTRTVSWLRSFIKNSQKVIRSGEPHANFLYRKYNNYKMPSFDFLSDKEINSILLYIRNESEAPSYVGGINGRHILAEDKSLIRDAVTHHHDQKSGMAYRWSTASLFHKLMFLFVSLLIAAIKIVVGMKVFKKLNKGQQKEI